MNSKEFSLHEFSFFVDKDVVLNSIQILCDESKSEQWDSALEIYQSSLSKYQEQPILLNSSLEELMSPLSEQLVKLSLDIAESLDTTDLTKFKMSNVCKAIQFISKVRGFKYVLKFFPHEVSQMEPNIKLLMMMKNNQFGDWEIKYVLLLWLSILCLIPFDIFSIDSNIVSNDKTEGSKLVEQILIICQEYLEDSGSSREASALCLASLLTRPDMDKKLLANFIHQTSTYIEFWTSKGDSASTELTTSYFKLLGYLHTLSLIFKKGHRENMIDFATKVFDYLVKLSEQNNQTNVRKLSTKIFQRLALIFLPPKVASWRYERGCRSLNLNLQGNNNNETLVEVLYQDDISSDIVPEIEEIIEHMLNSLKDKDTVVRWSAAKGIGRICMLLPHKLADDVLEAILNHFVDIDDDSAWHGGCLALAELSRRGLLLPERLSSVVPLINQAVQYDVLRGQHSIGSHVRDAACYVCWAFARAYSPDIMKPYMHDLTSSMLLTALFDREINCRRAASAAFQENVGRQGNDNFTFGIEIITLADYFSLSNRSNSYIEVAKSIACLDNIYLETFFDYLSQIKFQHWDENIRVLVSKALESLVPLSLELGSKALLNLIPFCTSNTLSMRHGAILSISSLLLALSQNSYEFPEEVSNQIINIVPNLIKLRLFRGRGGELLRMASCNLIENIAKSYLTLNSKMQVALLEILNENLRQPHEGVQLESCKALRSFLHTYFVFKNNPSQRMQDLTVSKYLNDLKIDDNVAVTRGSALALGILPPKLCMLPQGRIWEIIDCLETTSNQAFLVGGEPDIETRRNSLGSLVEIVEKLRPFIGFDVDISIYLKMIKIFQTASQDYSVDKRGDTGSWCRKIALVGLEKILCSAFTPIKGIAYANIQNNILTEENKCNFIDYQVYTVYGVGTLKSIANSYAEICYRKESLGCSLMDLALGKKHYLNIKDIFYLNLSSEGNSKTFVVTNDFNGGSEIQSDILGYIFEEEILTGIFSTILKQMAEKLDSIRDVAGNILERLLQYNNPSKIVFPERDLIDQSFQSISLPVNWSHPATVFKFLSNLFLSHNYFTQIMSGWILSAGGMTESISKESISILLGYSRQCLKVENDVFIPKLYTTLVGFLNDYLNEARLSVPLLKTLEILLKNGIFDSYIKTKPSLLNDFFHLVKIGISNSKEINKLNLFVDILLLVFDLSDDIDLKSLIVKQLVVLTAHNYPLIRKQSAEQLYLMSISSRLDFILDVNDGLQANDSDNNIDRKNNVLQILISTSWDGLIKNARNHRSNLYRLFGFSCEVRKKEDSENDSKKVTKNNQDELDSYESLVRVAGY